MPLAFDDAYAASGKQQFLGDSRCAVPSFHRAWRPHALGRRPHSIMPEIWRINPPAHPLRVYETWGVRAELLAFAKCDSAELEFSIPSHLIVLLPGGTVAGWKWRADCAPGSFRSGKDIVIFNPAREHFRIETRIPRGGCRVFILTIQPSVLTRLSESTGLERQIGVDDQAVRQSLLAIQEEIETPGLNSAVYVDALLTLLLTRLIRCASDSPRPHRPAKGGLPNWRLKRALELLEGDVAPSMVELGHLLRIRPTSFCRAFKQSTGISPHRYLLTHRVNRAKEMMEHHGRNLTQIALECGFSSSSQFSVVFKKMVGVCPSEYRRSL